MMMRVLELRESLRDSASTRLDQIQPGPVMNPKVKIHGLQTSGGRKAYGRIERPPKGELGFLFDQRQEALIPIAIAFVPPSFINLTILEDMCLGHTVADVMVILGSIDIVLGEVDR